MIGCAGFDVLLEESAAAGSEGAPNPEFLKHLAACPVCMAVFVGYSRATEMARAAYDPRDERDSRDRDEALPEACVSAILAAVRADLGDATVAFDVA